MISISSKTFDPEGHITLTPSAEDGLELTRRVNRSATLDGGATFDDMGFSWADVTLDLQIDNLSGPQAEQLSYICRTYGEVRYTDKNGAFSALVQGVTFERGAANLKLMLVGEA